MSWPIRRLNWLAAFWLAGILLMSWTPHVVQNKLPIPSQTLEADLPVPAPVERLLVRACYNCHASNSRLPWLAHIWPLSSKVAYEVNLGRSALNFSEWRRPQNDPALKARTLLASCSQMEAGLMPPSFYFYVDFAARVNSAHVKVFCDWARGQALKLTPPAAPQR